MAKAKRKKRGKGQGGPLIYGAVRSQPGEPPRKQQGRLLGSVAFEVDGLEARVGTNLPYGKWLELGTKHIAPRPWLRRALLEMRSQIQAVLGRRPL